MLLKRFDGFAPILTEIAPGGIFSDNEANLLDTRPSLQLLFPGDGRRQVSEALEIDEIFDVVA